MSLGYFEAWPGCAEVGYWTAPNARGRGVATEALGVLARWAFGALGAHRLELYHATENVASCRIADRCGFAYEGVARAALPDPGRAGGSTWSATPGWSRTRPELRTRLEADRP